MTIKTHIIRIGNSQGIRIPKPLLEQSGISGAVELEVENNRIVIQSVDEPRRGWKEAFASMAEEADDHLIDDEAIESAWDSEEWEWE